MKSNGLGDARLAPSMTFLFVMAALLSSGASRAQSADEGDHAQADALSRVLELAPLSFVENVGQSAKAIRYESRGPLGTIGLTNDSIYLTLPVPPRDDVGAATVLRDRIALVDRGNAPRTRTIRTAFLGASMPEIDAADRATARVSYFRGSDPSAWIRGLPTHGAVVYRGLYPGIAGRFDGRVGALKGTWFVDVGADPSVIAWRYDGIESLALDASGNLVLTLVDDGETRTIEESAPVAWQDLREGRVDVAARFALSEDGTIRFELGDWDRSAPLVIDPQLVYSSYLGGNGTDHAVAVQVDDMGRIYLTGRTHSNPSIALGNGWPVTPNSFNQIYGGEVADAYVMRFAPDARSLEYSAYLGGGNSTNFQVFGGADWGLDIAIDAQYCAHVTGMTESSNFPITANASKNVKPTSFADAYVAKVSADGSTLLYSSFIGGTDVEWGVSVDVDQQGRTWVAGYTSSSDFPVTADAVQPTFGGVFDGFVAGFDTAGSGTMFYGSYLGFESNDQISAMKVGPGGLINVVGVTYSTMNLSTLPSFVGMSLFQPTNAGMVDGFVAVIDPATPGPLGLVYMTYLGGSGLDACFGIDVDEFGRIYIAGSTSSVDFPLRFSQLPFSGAADAFVASILPVGIGYNDLVFSVLLGGSGVDQGAAVQVHGNAVYFSGQIDTPFGSDAFWGQVTRDYGQFVVAAVHGSNFFEAGLDLHVGDYGITLVGYTQCQNGQTANHGCTTNFPILHPFQAAYGGGSGDGFIARYSNGRVTTGLLALYEMNETSGTTVHDTSGFGLPLDLRIRHAAAASWVNGGLSLDSATIVESSRSAAKIVDACQATNEITIEVWVRPDNAYQTGPAPMVTISQGTLARNVTLGQVDDGYDVQVRTTTTPRGGAPLATDATVVAGRLSHVVFTRSANGVANLYVDGALVKTAAGSGDFSSWERKMTLALGNEPTLTRPWLGRMDLVAIYDRALTQSQIVRNLIAGAN